MVRHPAGARRHRARGHAGDARPTGVHALAVRLGPDPRDPVGPGLIPGAPVRLGDPRPEFRAARPDARSVRRTRSALPTSLDRVSPALAAALQAGATAAGATVARAHSPPSCSTCQSTAASSRSGLMLAELPAEGAALPGMILLPAGPGRARASMSTLADGWAFDVRAGTDLAAQLGVVIRPGEVSVRYPFAPGQTLPSAGFGVTLAYAPETLKFVFGQPGKTRLELAKAEHRPCRRRQGRRPGAEGSRRGPGARPRGEPGGHRLVPWRRARRQGGAD